MRKRIFKEELILAAFVCDYEVVKELVEKPEFDKSLIDDIKVFDTPFPLYYFTVLAKTVFYDTYIDSIMPMVRTIRHNCELLTIFWKNKFDIDIEQITIDYQQFKDYFYSREDEEQYLEDFEEFAHIQARRIDYDLFEEAVKFRFDKVEELLEQGANPSFEFYTPSDIINVGSKNEWIDKISALERIGGEQSFLCSCQIMPIYESYYLKHHKIHIDDVIDIGDLIGWVAHNEMERLLNSYIIPKSSREAFVLLDTVFTEKEKIEFLQVTHPFDLHFGLGMWIRNHWIYSHQEEIMKAFGLYKEEDGFPNTYLYLPDHMSDIIVKRYIQHLKRKFVK
jgi:hypothetical protein